MKAEQRKAGKVTLQESPSSPLSHFPISLMKFDVLMCGDVDENEHENEDEDFGIPTSGKFAVNK